MLGVLGVLAFIVGLLGSVMLHEAGHFLTARRYGMKATQFFVGFGPTLWSTRRGETEYGIKAVPAGGFVKIVGMTPLEDVEPGDEERAFYRQPAGRKTVVLAAGSTVHFALCLLLVAFAVIVFGVQRETAPTLTAINACVADDPATKCGAGSVPAPAKAAGLQAGDVVTAVDGVDVSGSDELVTRVKASAGAPVRLTVLRKGQVQVLTVTPKPVTRPGATAPVGAIGVSIAANYEYQHFGPVGVVRETGATVKLLVTGTWETLTNKLGTISKVYSPDRDPSGFIGVVGVGRISGEIAQAKVSTTDKLNGIVLLLAGLNLFVGVFNLLPLLPLDGGHIAVVWFEAVRDRLRRIRGYTGELQRVDMNKLMPVTLAVVVLFIGFTLFLLGADIVNPITIN
ncbi:MAG TPA: site-2 protease family protein [Mycobacteriales bacterium]|nr:site-2 protease family protein [Mycobacteriales bacterium]